MSKAETSIAFGLILKYFDNNINEAYKWWHTLNPNLGGISPDEMVQLGREKRLLKWIKQQIKDNQ